MRYLPLGTALTLLLASMACARSKPVGGGDPAPGTISSSASAGPATDASGLPAAMRPNVAVPDERVTDLRAVPWARAVALDGNGLQISYSITGRGDCSALGRVDVTETAREVTVTVLVGRLPGADCAEPQPQLAALISTVVTLTAPLGSRRVRDGTAG